MKTILIRITLMVVLLCGISGTTMGQIVTVAAAPATPLALQAVAHPAMQVSATLPVTLPVNVTGSPGTQVTIPVRLPQPADGLGITAYEFTVAFDSTVLAIAGVSTAGTLSAGWLVTPQLNTPGEVSVIAFSVNPLSGSGTLINLLFTVVATPNVPSPLTWTNVLLNEGDPAAETTDGSFIGQSVAITLPDDATGAPNSQVTIPVQVESPVDGLEVIAYSFRLTFDPAVLSLPATPSEAYATAGTLSDGWTVTANTDIPGELRLAGFHIAPLSGSGTLLNLVFDVVGSANSSTTLTWSDFLFNEGVPGVQTTDGFFTVLAYTLGGQVFYQDRANRAMSGVTIDLSGDTTDQATTDGAGYSFTTTTTGAHTLTPSYNGPVNGISAFDAAYIAQCVAGLRDSADCPLLAADTSGNSALSAFDAALIAQYAAGLAGPTSRVGTWVFDPVERTYATIDSDLPSEDFAAYLVGEVTGNWSAPVPAAVAAGTGDADATSSHTQLLPFVVNAEQ